MDLKMKKIGKGIVIEIIQGVVILGGIRKIERVDEVVVNLMELEYIMMEI